MNDSFYVVGLGASGLGISALLDFLRTIPDNSGAAYIAITHQKKDSKSHFYSLIDKASRIPVISATASTKVMPNRVYVIAEGTFLTVKDGYLVIEPRPADTRLNDAIDRLFSSLASDCKTKAVGIIFWGLGHDGLKGINAIESENGYVIVQRPDDSINSEMAQWAIDRDHPNLVTTVSEMSDFLLAHMNRPAEKHL